VGVGFLGVLLMTRPGSAALDLPTLAALGASFFFALSIVTVKDLTRDHSTLTLVLWTNAFTTLVGLPFALVEWVTPGWWDLVLLIALGVAGVGAQSCYVRALSHGEASALGVVDYVRLPLAILLGFALFAERPDTATLAGSGVVIAATVYIAWRESRRRIARPPGEPAS
jgi:drug/metabolite transporter (DMT)-like permease